MNKQKLFDLFLVALVALAVGYWLAYAEYQPWAETGKTLSSIKPVIPQ